jgi:aryl-alcohol dehydrogenase-like predicted oxidoreductase
MKRRDFLKTSAAIAPMMSMFPSDLSSLVRESLPGKIEKRSLGRTGEMLSMIGFGGIIVMDATAAEASEAVKLAIDSGINYFDVAPTYGDAELKLGPALEPYRKSVFLACKTTERGRDGSRKELEQSLKNLRTDHVDLYQFHAVTTQDDVEKIFAPGGALETYLEAKKEGKIRFMGFSAHSVEAAEAMMDRFDFDTILFPVNYIIWNKGNFGPQVLQKAHQKQMGILALKSMAKGPLPKGVENKEYPKCWYEPLTDPEDIKMGLGFTLSHPVTAALTPGDIRLFRTALNVSGSIKPLKDNEIQLIKEKALKGEPLFKYPRT